MLKSHKNFHSHTNSRQNWLYAFLKKLQKPCFWAIFDHFWSFLLKGDFSKKSGCHTQLYMGPQHNAKFQKKTNEPILRKLTDREKDGWKDGWTNRLYFIGPFQPRLVVQQRQLQCAMHYNTNGIKSFLINKVLMRIP